MDGNQNAAVRRMSLPGFLVLGVFFLFTMTGCITPIALHSGILNYDKTVSQVEMDILLLNIARARYHHPLHFTLTSSVAATFDFRTTAGIEVEGGALLGSVGPLLSVSAAESPTISIVPIQGEEFAQRILTPASENQFEFLYHRGMDPQLLLRLMGDRIVMEQENSHPIILVNQPSQTKSYQEYRRRILHLASLHHDQQLYIGRLHFRKVWPLPLNHPLTWRALEQEYEWEETDSGGAPLLSRRVIGRVLITNYDPRRLSDSARHRLYLKIRQFPLDAVYVDIDPNYAGGTYPFQGHIYLRSFEDAIRSVARGIAEEPEYDVAPDERSGWIERNPIKTLEILETSEIPSDAAFAVDFQGRWYSIQEESQEDPKRHHWNMQAFRLLYQWFQLTVRDLKHVTPFPITIGK